MMIDWEERQTACMVSVTGKSEIEKKTVGFNDRHGERRNKAWTIDATGDSEVESADKDTKNNANRSKLSMK